MKFKEWITREKISVIQVARQLEVHENHLYLILKGVRYPGYHLAKAIQDYTKGEVTMDELVKAKKAPLKCPHCGQKMKKVKESMANVESKT